jgi:stage V sporulation protein AC
MSKNKYDKMVKKVSPKSNLFMNCLKAFVVGGLICVGGQIITNVLKGFGVGMEDGKSFTSVILIFLGAFFTGLDMYDSLGEFAGAGSIIPITGFANSIVSSAIEYKKEGYIMGVGAKMFTIAGPVIVYGVISSVVVGLIKLILEVI